MNSKGFIKGLSFFAIAAFFALAASASAWGQTTIAVQDFEVAPATPTLAYTNTGGTISTGQNPMTGNPADANLFAGGAQGFQVVNGTATLNFANQSLAGFTNNSVEFRLAGMSINATNGIDTADAVTLAISLDGGTTFSNEVRINGSAANQRYDFTATGLSATTYDGDNAPTAVPTSSGMAGISTVRLSLPNSATQVQVRITLFNNDSNERWVIDNVLIRGTAASGPPTISINDVSQNELNSGTSTFTFTVSLSAPAPAGGVTFDIATADGTATVADADYIANTLTGQTIPAGSQMSTFAVTVNGDTTIEPTENFFVNLTNVVGATVSDGQGMGTIVTDDIAPTVSLAISPTGGTEAGATLFTATVTATAAVIGDQTVNFAISGGTATTADFTAFPATITIPNGMTTASVSFSVVNDAIAEGRERATFTISAPSGGVSLGATTSQTVTIDDDDAAACAVVLVNEVLADAVGSDATEYVELRGVPSTPGTVCAIPLNTYFMAVEGDSGSALGTADFVVDAGGLLLGTNGLLFIKGATGAFPTPAGTVELIDSQLGTAIENGSITFLVVNSPTTPIVEGTDYDANNDGTLEALPADAVILNSVGYTDGGAGDVVYTPAVLTQSAGTPDALSRFPNNNTPNSAAAFFNGDLITGGTNMDRRYDPTRASANFPPNGMAAVTPGSPNLAPTASSVSLGGRITDRFGRALRQVDVTLTKSSGEVFYTKTGIKGLYWFGDLPAGDTYIISVYSKRHYFSEPTRVINLNENLTDVDFIGAGR